MLARLIEFSLRQRVLVLIAACVLSAAGVWAYVNLPIDAFPDISPTQVKVVLKVPGMTRRWSSSASRRRSNRNCWAFRTRPSCARCPKYGISDVTMDFEEGVDFYWARQQVSERLAGLARDLPSTAEGGLAPITTRWARCSCSPSRAKTTHLPSGAACSTGLSGRPAYRTGRRRRNALGGEVRSYEVIPDPSRLRARGVTLEQLRQALDTNNRNDGAGRLDRGDEHWVVRRGRGHTRAR